MAKFVLGKTIDARKLNKRTGIPTAEPSVTIPYGAIIDSLAPDGDVDKFTYLGEPYQCPHDIMAGALQAAPGAQKPEAAPAAAKAAKPEAAAAELHWETVPSSEFEVRRAKVPGGWLVTAGGGVTFLPDPDHAWDAGSPE
jgi:hypothetical protein